MLRFRGFSLAAYKGRAYTHTHTILVFFVVRLHQTVCATLRRKVSEILNLKFSCCEGLSRRLLYVYNVCLYAPMSRPTHSLECERLVKGYWNISYLHMQSIHFYQHCACRLCGELDESTRTRYTRVWMVTLSERFSIQSLLLMRISIKSQHYMCTFCTNIHLNKHTCNPTADDNALSTITNIQIGNVLCKSAEKNVRRSGWFGEIIWS